MSNLRNDGAEVAAKKYYYKVCPHCGARTHIDAEYCVRCGKKVDTAGGIKTFYPIETDPGVERPNLDHPDGCRMCAAACRYCRSFGAEPPDLKARCEYCESPEKAACCKKARKLPSLGAAIPDLTLSDVMAGKFGDFKEIMAAFKELYAEEVGKCRSHVRAEERERA